MEQGKKKENIFLKILQVISDSQLKINEYIFIIIVTMLEMAVPFLCYFNRASISPMLMGILVLVVIAFCFVLFLDVEEFYETNHVDYIYFQIVLFVLTFLLSLILIGVYRNEFLVGLERIADVFWGAHYNLSASIYVGVLLYIAGVIIVALSIFFFDLIIALTTLLYAKLNHIEINNPYIERIKAAGSAQGREEYIKKVILEEYERMAEEGTYKPKPLFENTKYFKGITDLEQVRPRYLSLMKKYHPDNNEGTVEICQEIQEEYHEIEKKYSL